MSHLSAKKYITLLLVPLCLSSCGEKDPHFKDFTYAGTGADFTESVYYDDAFFEASSFVYNPHLASASVSFAMASFASGENKLIQTLYRYANIEQLLSETGFQQFEANNDYKRKSETDTIGIVFGNKKIGDKTLIYVGVRGANYEAEWASNLSIADPSKEYVLETEPTYHWGFRKAANQLITELSSYIAKNNITGSLKIWTSGYSRAGATTNIASGLLDQAIDSGEHPLGENVSLVKEDLYAYCFEPPMGAPSLTDENGKLLARGEKYGNIFNHVNFNDPVPLVAMKEVNFTRFGQDRFYPDKMSYLDDGRFLSRTVSFYEGMPNYLARGGKYFISSFETKTVKGFSLSKDNSLNWTQGLFLKEFVSALTLYGLGAATYDDVPAAKDRYVKNIQPAARFIFDLIYRSGNFKGSFIDLGVSIINDITSTFELDDLINDILVKEQRAYLCDDLSILLRRGLEKFGIEGFTLTEAREKIDAFLKLLLTFTDAALEIMAKPQMVFTWLTKNNITSIASGHYPELCLAATRALDSYYGNDPFVNTNHVGKYYDLTAFDTSYDLTITKKDGTPVAKFSQGEIVEAIVPVRVVTNQYEAILPYGEEYRITYTGNADYLFASIYDYTYRDGDLPVEVLRESENVYSLPL